jgi:hypothetical protein
VHPDLLAPKHFGLAQALQRLLWQLKLHAEDHDLMEPHAGGLEPGLEIGLRGQRRLRYRRAATARAPSEKSSSWRGQRSFMVAP